MTAPRDEQLALLPDPPRYWRDETSGALAAAVEKYLHNSALTPNEIRYLRFYICQWVNSSAWDLNPNASADGTKALAELRESAAQVYSIGQLDRWLNQAVHLGIDPF